MNSPPAAEPAVKSTIAAGVAVTAGQPEPLSSRVRIANNPRNTAGLVRRRDAQFFLDHGRARYLGRDHNGQDQIALIESHTLNAAQAAQAATGYDWPAGKAVTRQELLNIGVVGEQTHTRNVGRGALGRRTGDRSISFPPVREIERETHDTASTR